jgi:hypothetical protein
MNGKKDGVKCLLLRPVQYLGLASCIATSSVSFAEAGDASSVRRPRPQDEAIFNLFYSKLCSCHDIQCLHGDEVGQQLPGQPHPKPNSFGPQSGTKYHGMKHCNRRYSSHAYGQHVSMLASSG